MLDFLQLYTSVNPQFASLFRFNLIQEDENLKVEVVFNGKKMEVDTCESVPCSWKEFKEFVNERSIPGFIEICKTDPSDEVLKSLRGKIKSKIGKNEVVKEKRTEETTIICG